MLQHWLNPLLLDLIGHCSIYFMLQHWLNPLLLGLIGPSTVTVQSRRSVKFSEVGDDEYQAQ